MLAPQTSTAPCTKDAPPVNFRPYIRLLLAIAALGALPSASAHAWAPKVHRIVCTLAWDSVDEAVRVRIRDVLNITAREQFAERCARSDADLKERPEDAVLHMMLIPAGAISLDPDRDCADGCVLREIERNIAILKGQATRTEKAAALPQLAHMIADAHQPLNMGYIGDGGGETLNALFKGEPTTMRAIWEERLLDAAPEPEAPNGIVRIYGLLFQVGGPREYWIQTTPFDWVKESFYIMRTPATGYIGNTGGLAFDDIYIKQNQIIALEQIQKAAVRLTHLLPDLVGP